MKKKADFKLIFLNYKISISLTEIHQIFGCMSPYKHQLGAEWPASVLSAERDHCMYSVPFIREISLAVDNDVQ